MIPEEVGSMHMGRSWSGSRLEDECPCPQEACGLVRLDRASENHASGASGPYVSGGATWRVG